MFVTDENRLTENTSEPSTLMSKKRLVVMVEFPADPLFVMFISAAENPTAPVSVVEARVCDWLTV